MLDLRWRSIQTQRNSLAALHSACEKAGYTFTQTDTPGGDCTLYSLNSLTAPSYLDEIQNAPCITIIGGPHATACYHELTDIADYVIVGEGEYTLPLLLHALETNSPVPPGVATKNGYTPATTSVYLNAYPCFTKMKGYIEITRGCPYQCGYCQTPSLFGREMRHRSVDAIAECLQYVHDLRFVTPNALAYGSTDKTPRYEKIELLLKTLTADTKKHAYFGTFPGEVRPEYITEHALELILKYSSGNKIHFGAQSGSDHILQKIHRGHTVSDIYHALDLCKQYDIVPIVDLIVGLPGESESDQKETVTLAKDIIRQGKVHAHLFLPLPGTRFSHETSGHIFPETNKVFGSLALAKKLTGSWNRKAP
ncbi:MAG: TIGR04013 family B12-binding domain/radical SAM domain-containing protein [Methanomicrobiales archaeon]|jgi:B12-binding domain/radical SAM domain protein|nr:TIGR04013 family B12-binding domain/radical SAM domain-containing protein [Methanomicrobiales archaeon]